MEYYSATQKNENLSFVVTWMDLEDTMLSEISQTQKDPHTGISLVRDLKTLSLEEWRVE
jgi:hypothetical protein